MSYCDVRLNKLSRSYIDGLPLDLASKLVPWKTKWSLHIASHLHLHAKNVLTGGRSGSQPSIGLNGLRGILDSLETLVRGLSWRNPPSTWKNYYSETNYSDKAMQEKLKIVDELILSVSPLPSDVWDLGANSGRFSELASRRGIPTVAWDLDAGAIESCYQSVKQRNDAFLLPLIQDLTNPSPGLGWAHHERESLADRGPTDLILALALIHHLAIGNNVPLPEIATFLSKIGKNLIIEFVPKEDSQVQRLLSQRQDIFDNYTQNGFEEAFQSHFQTIGVRPISGTRRTLYLMQRRKDQ
jgi:hypothetical protein